MRNMRTVKFIFQMALLLMLCSVGLAQSFGNIETKTGKVTQPEEKPEMRLPDNILALEMTINPANYILGPGDELGLNILTSENITFPLKVTPTGDLFIPAVGIVHVEGLNLSVAARNVEEFIHANAYPNAQVNLVLLNVRYFKIQISGAVNAPGFVIATPADRLNEIIEKCEGFHQLAREFSLEVTRGTGEKLQINYLKYLREGDLENNPTFLEGDRIFVPFGDMKTEGIVLRGAVEGAGYDIIEPHELLGSFLQRSVIFNKNADLESVMITRTENGKNVFVSIDPENLFSTELHAGETIDIQWEKGIMINGFVLAPGGFEFFPGYTAADYISMAGGNTVNGNPNRCTVRHRDGSEERGSGVLVRRGDVIIVPRTIKDYIIGDLSALQIVVSVMTIYLTFLATGG